MVVLKEITSMFWGITLDGGKRYTQTVERSFNITMAAIEPPSDGKLSPVSVMVQVDKAEFLLCTLGYGNLLQQKLELLFTEGEEVTFFLNGSGVVHLTGFLVEDQMEGVYPEDIGSLDSDSDEGCKQSSCCAPELVDEEDTDSEDDALVQVGKKRKMRAVQEGKKKIRTLDDIEDDDDDDDDDDSDFDVLEEMDDSMYNEDSDEEDEEDVEEKLVQTPSKEGKKKEKKTDKKSPQKTEKSNSKVEVSTPQADSTEGKKKKKKKKKNKNKAEENNQVKTDTGTPKVETPKKRVLAGGLMVEEVKGGHGPDAKSGKVVSVYYVGKLANNGKQFDSCQSGKPFKFRLGKNEVIKGWDQGLQGMKVGGKRRLTIPPQLGYGNQRQGPIPPNATLVFDVELKAVN